jgi:hypothetical protein
VEEESGPEEFILMAEEMHLDRGIEMWRAAVLQWTGEYWLWLRGFGPQLNVVA